MNTEFLEKGKVIKNYKELCAMLEEPNKTGKSKQLQIKDWERYFKFHKQGNKIIIDEIYEIPKEKEDKRANNKGGNNSIYKEDVDRLILHMCSELQNSKFNYIELTLNGFLNKLHMINNNYSVGRNNMDKFSRWAEIPIETMYDFFNSQYKKNKDILEYGLKRLERRSLIDVTLIHKVFTIDNIHRNATDGEIEGILEIEQEILKNIKVKDKQEAFINGKWNLFQKEKTEMLKNMMGLQYDYKAYHIVTTKSFREMLLNEYEKGESEFSLNWNIQKSAINSATKRHDFMCEKYRGEGNSLGKPKYDKEKNRLSDNYINDSTRVAKICIDTIDPINLWKEIQEMNGEKYTYKESIKTDNEKQWEEIFGSCDLDELFS